MNTVRWYHKVLITSGGVALLAAYTSQENQRAVLSEVSFILLGTGIVMLIVGAIIHATREQFSDDSSKSAVQTWLLLQAARRGDYRLFVGLWDSMNDIDKATSAVVLSNTVAMMVDHYGKDALEMLNAKMDEKVANLREKEDAR